MSKKLTDNVSSAENQQAMSQAMFYYTGFCCGEMSCSLLRLSNRKSKSGGVYYTPDITISNADFSLLQEINQVVGDGIGVMSPIKGGYNLSFRGKLKVKKIISFFEKYSPIVGDIVLSRLQLLQKAIELLESQRGLRRSQEQQNQLEEIRKKLRVIKVTAIPSSNFLKEIFDREAIGHFLSGVLDAEGSVGMKKNGNRKQPFVAVAMRDRKIIELFLTYLKYGNIHFRPKDNVYHFEIGARQEVLTVIKMFSEEFPSKLLKMKSRIIALQQVLNDYTPRRNKIVPHDIV